MTPQKRRQPERLKRALTAALVCFCTSFTAAAQNSDEAEHLQQQLDELRAAIAALRGEEALGDRLDELERQIEVLAEEIEVLKLGEGVVGADEGTHGMGPAASKIYRTEKGISIGGYGEALYEGFSSSREDGSSSEATDQFDYLRAVLYFGYKFSDRWLFNSEIEFEHASTDNHGSTSVEFAYIDFLGKESLNARAGLVLLPMGWVNELHEPTLFLSAQRPNVEQRILPSTWRENGVGMFGDAGGFTYRTYVVNGLDASGFSAEGLRGGRQNGSKAAAEDFAWTGRVDYTGLPGLLAGVSAYFGNAGQGLKDELGRAIDAATDIVDLHAEWRYKGLRLRGLWARSEVSDVARLNAALGKIGNDSIGEELEGYYLEIGYDVLARRGGEMSLTPFLRAESFDTQQKVPSGFDPNPANDVDVLTLGLAFQPLDQLIFKLDYEDWSNGANTAVDQWNFALGYVF